MKNIYITSCEKSIQAWFITLLYECLEVYCTLDTIKCLIPMYIYLKGKTFIMIIDNTYTYSTY